MMLQGRLIKAAQQFGPLLFRLLPKKWLRKIKNKLVENSLRRLKQWKRIPFHPSAYPAGINLIGNIRAETGLGQSCRLLAKELAFSDLPFIVKLYEQTGNLEQTNHSLDHWLSADCPYGMNLLHINPRELGAALAQMELSLLNQRYNIGFWLWELEEFPEEWKQYFQFLDEIWTPSEFISRAIRKKTNLPVITIPYAVSVNYDASIQRNYFGLPEHTFLFFMAFDNSSIAERKNPAGAIRAFQKAFAPKDHSVGLAVKAVHLTQTELKQLKKLCGTYENIYFLTKTLEKIKFNSLLHCCDAVLSLHRAEGFGLVLAEAMYLGKPVIATNWSANTEFMNQESACMIDYQLITLTKDYGPFQKGQHWADPDLNQAAEVMKQLKNDKQFYQMKSRSGQKAIQSRLCPEHISELLKQRFDAIYAGKE